MNASSIFFVIDNYTGPSGGTEKQLLALISGLLAYGYAPRLFVLRHTPYTRSVTDFPCPIEDLEIGSLRSPATLRRMLAFRRRVQTQRPVVVHAFFNDAAILVPLLVGGAGVPVLSSRRDMGFWYTPGYLALLRLANRRVHRIICNARAVADEVATREGTPREKLAVIYNGLDPEEFSPSYQASREPEAGRDTKPLRICLLANLRPVKRIEDFLRAAAQLRTVAPETRFVVVGESLSCDYERYLHELATELDLATQLEFAGHSADPTGILRECDIGVLSSESEGLSNAVLEYLACGLPVVCSDVGGNAELVSHGENGFLYPAGDVDALAGHLSYLCAHPAERTRLGAASLARARDFSTERMIAAHVEAYQGGHG